MAYQKTQDRSYTALKILFSIAVIAGLGVIAFVVWFGQPTTTSTVTVSQSEGGQIAQLSDNQFVAGANTEQSTSPAPTAPATPMPEQTAPEAASDKPHTLKLPAGWSQTNSVTDVNPCDPSLEQVIETYTSAQEILTLYVNGSPTGCDNSTIGDVYYDYDFNADGSKITVNTANNPPFCTKETNQTCPKGDGKVTVFIGNGSASDPNILEKSTVTGKTYYFSVVDSNLETDLGNQAATLAELVEALQIN